MSICFPFALPLARLARRTCHVVAALMGSFAPFSTAAQAELPADGLPIYSIVRTLEIVQDEVVNGDHASSGMQRYLLKVLDRRLRLAVGDDFDDPRNIDGALIYAMSGGNPATLSYLMARDRLGHFDSRLVSALDAYFNSRLAEAVPELAALAGEFRDTRLGAYVSLVAGAALSTSDEEEALKLFDWVRLLAPGTILEESALRRALGMAVKANLTQQAMVYAQHYVRRFLRSPYAGQFADLVTTAVVNDIDAVDNEMLDHILVHMDLARQREIYLRISRAAAVKGKTEMARRASRKAQAVSVAAKSGQSTTLAQFYSAVASVNSDEIVGAIEKMDAIPDDALSERDRKLREAARAMAEAIMRPPDPSLIAQQTAPDGPIASQNDGAAGSVDETAQIDAQAGSDPASVPENTLSSETIVPAAPMPGSALEAQDPEFGDYMAANRKTLQRIDQLLERDRR